MFDFKKKKNDVDDKSVYYEIDKKSRMIIEKYMKKIGLGDITFYELLIMLGFNLNNKLYLKLKQDSNGLIIYYSYDKDNFNKYDYIRFRYMLYRHIMVESKDSYKEYYIKWEYPTGKLCLENEKFYKRKKIDEVEYCITLYNGEFKISTKDSTGREIKFSCDIEELNKQKILAIISNQNYNRDNKILDDKIDDVFEKFVHIFNLFNIGFDNMSLTFYKDGLITSGYWLKEYKSKYNNKLEFKTKSDVGEITYERTILNEYLDTTEKSEVSIKLKHNSFQFVFFDYLDSGFILDIKNEIKLINYFKNLRFPIQIDKICKDISEIILKDMDNMCLKIYHNDVRTGVLSIKNGKLDYFQKIIDDKRVIINHGGVFSYRNKEEVSSYSVDMTGDIVTRYEQVSERGICNGDDSDRVMYKAIREAKEEKIKVRKLVDELIK